MYYRKSAALVLILSQEALKQLASSDMIKTGSLSTIKKYYMYIPMVTKTESYFIVKENDPRWGKYYIQTVLTRKKTSVRSNWSFLRQCSYRCATP